MELGRYRFVGLLEMKPQAQTLQRSQLQHIFGNKNGALHAYTIEKSAVVLF